MAKKPLLAARLLFFSEIFSQLQLTLMGDHTIRREGMP
jgi:hypothetical protein